MTDPVPPAPAPKRSGATTAALIAAAVAIAAPLTAHFEGLRTHPYRDPAPKHTMTVCYGETKVEMRVYTPDECLMLLRTHEANDYAPAVLKCTPGIAAKPEILAAATDAAYNAGPGNYCTSPMAAAFNRGALVAGCNAFVGWHVAPGGKLLAGLVKRRNAERALCLKGVSP